MAAPILTPHTSASGEPTARAQSPTKINDPAAQHLKGFKLALLVGTLTLVFFLTLLDTSIVGTVSFNNRRS